MHRSRGLQRGGRLSSRGGGLLGDKVGDSAFDLAEGTFKGRLKNFRLMERLCGSPSFVDSLPIMPIKVGAFSSQLDLVSFQACQRCTDIALGQSAVNIYCVDRKGVV